jgi:hypothetical protein
MRATASAIHSLNPRLTTRGVLLVLIFALACTLLGRIEAVAQAPPDQVAPIISFVRAMGPMDISGGGDVDQNCEATVFFMATITDNCCIQTAGVTVGPILEITGNATLGTPVIEMTHTMAPPGFPEGQSVTVQGSVLVHSVIGCPATVEVTISATDCSGNEALPVTWYRDVTDSTPPEIVCPDHIVLVGCDAVLDLGAPTVTDNCDPSPSVEGVRSDGLDLTEPFPCGVTTVTWTAMDRCGNETSCTQEVSAAAPSGPPAGGDCISGPTPTAGPDVDACFASRVQLDARGSSGVGPLQFLWTFSVRYYESGKPIYDIPEGSRADLTAEGFDTPTPSFVPDIPGIYRLTVTVKDETGKQTMDQVAVEVFDCDETATASYERGWNLVSTALQPVETALRPALADTSASVTTLAYVGGKYVPMDELSPTTGVWVYFEQPETVVIRGRSIQEDVEIHLDNAGWHAISSPFPIAWSDVQVLIHGVEARPLWHDLAQAHIVDQLLCLDSEGGVYRETNLIVPSRGYMVRTLQDDVILLLRWDSRAADTWSGPGVCFMGPAMSGVPTLPASAYLEGLSAKAYPTPVRHSVVHFEAIGTLPVERVRVSVFSMDGYRVWRGESEGRLLDWNVHSSEGELLPWGPYTYLLEAYVHGAWRLADRDVLFIAEVD